MKDEEYEQRKKKDEEYEKRRRKEEDDKKKVENKDNISKKNREFDNQIHMEIHAVRRLQSYKASPMEMNISKFVIERFKDECKECKEMGEKKKEQPDKKPGFLAKLGRLADS